MRIISGRLGGRRIKTVEGEGYRPAMGKTRESLFSMLTSRGVVWEGARVLDLFAGSGSLAFEAVSRGAELAVLVENSAVAARCLADNIRQLGVEDCVRLTRDDVRKTLNNTPMGCFDLVFLDPTARTCSTPPCRACSNVTGWRPAPSSAPRSKKTPSWPLPTVWNCWWNAILVKPAY